MAAINQELRLVVRENDSPYGSFVFPDDDREISIPEDYNPGEEATTTKSLTVKRNLGVFGTVTVCINLFT